MSANFLDTSGSCTGMDPHLYYGIGPAGVPLPMPLVPHIVFYKHSWKSRDWRIATTVTTCGNPVLQSNWAMMCVIHVPTFPTTPHALELIQIHSIIMAGSATPQLTAHKVTAQGSPLCTAISGSFGLNLDCGDLPSPSKDLNPNTVMTQPTLGDYIAAILSAALSFLYAYAVSWALGKALPTEKPTNNKEMEEFVLNLVKGALASVSVAVVQTLADLVNSKGDDGSWLGDPVAVATSKVTALVQQLVDGEA